MFAIYKFVVIFSCWIFYFSTLCDGICDLPGLSEITILAVEGLFLTTFEGLGEADFLSLDFDFLTKFYFFGSFFEISFGLAATAV